MYACMRVAGAHRLEQNLRTARVLGQEIAHVVHLPADAQPRVGAARVLRHLLRGDAPPTPATTCTAAAAERERESCYWRAVHAMP